MISKAWRSAVRFLGSAGFATLLLAVLGVWSILGTAVPQSTESEAAVSAWAAAHPLLESVVRVVGLHHAFTAVIFIVCCVALGLSTMLCAWERTKVALGKARRLKRAAQADAQSVVSTRDFEIECREGLSRPEALSRTAETLAGVGIKTKTRGDVLSSVSAPWTVWGSPVFHWALLALMIGLVTSSALRADGLMGIAVGQTRPDAPQSYGLLHTGRLYNWNQVHRSIRVDDFNPDYQSGGISRGPTPTVSVLNASGVPIKTQLVYPNHTLKYGSFTIYPSDFGLAAAISRVDSAGVDLGGSIQYLDFSDTATDGVEPVGFLVLSDSAGNPQYRLFVTIPLERDGQGKPIKRLPSVAQARVVLADLSGNVVVNRLVGPGEPVAVPNGGSLQVNAATYYARLSLVDDRSIPLLFAGVIVALVGLTVAVAARQQVVLAAVTEDADGVRVAVSLRLWRNPSSSRSEIESELTRALGTIEEGNLT